MTKTSRTILKTFFSFGFLFFILLLDTYPQEAEKKENWLNRWKEFESQRLGSDGFPARPEIYLEEAINASLLKDQAANRSTGLPLASQIQSQACR